MISDEADVQSKVGRRLVAVGYGPLHHLLNSLINKTITIRTATYKSQRWRPCHLLSSV
jgi:hypothetical protein